MTKCYFKKPDVSFCSPKKLDSISQTFFFDAAQSGVTEKAFFQLESKPVMNMSNAPASDCHNSAVGN